MKTTKLNVTKELITQAIKKDSNRCMLSDAVRIACPSAKYIHSDLQSIRFSDMKRKRRYCYFTPPEAQIALLAFDQGEVVSPFTVTLAKGTETKTGLVATHPNFKRKPRKTKAARKTRIYPKREREYGLRKIVK